MSKARFDWDPEKDEENQQKHGVSFARAQYAFADPSRVIAQDLAHIASPKTVSSVLARSMAACLPFDLPTGMPLFESSAPATGEKERLSMSTKIKYTDEPFGDVQVVPDFLPSPAELAFREEGVKITLALSKKSLEFFKSEASKHHTQYQRMIRRLLDAYVDSQANALTSRSTGTARKRAAR